MMDAGMTPPMHDGRDKHLDAKLRLRPTKLDWLIYRLFRWWWRRWLHQHPQLTAGIEHLYRTRELADYQFAQCEDNAGGDMTPPGIAQHCDGKYTRDR